jgi:hypothetical protein
MLIVLVLVGLILTLLGFELVSAVGDTLHTRANIDAESQARVTMQKIDTHLRVAYYDYVDDPNPGTPLPVISPIPAPTPSAAPYITFYRVASGGLSSTNPQQCKGSIGSGGPLANSGAPCPPFELVTIQLNPSVPGELDEIVTPLPGTTQNRPVVLGTDVTNFGVTALSSDEFQITLTVSVPSWQCATNRCSFTLSHDVFVAGGASPQV